MSRVLVWEAVRREDRPNGKTRYPAPSESNLHVLLKPSPQSPLLGPNEGLNRACGGFTAESGYVYFHTQTLPHRPLMLPPTCGNRLSNLVRVDTTSLQRDCTHWCAISMAFRATSLSGSQSAVGIE